MPPKWDSVDPLKGARAEIEQIDAGLKSRTQALAERGYDAEQVGRRNCCRQRAKKSVGLGARRHVASAPAGGAPALCSYSRANGGVQVI